MNNSPHAHRGKAQLCHVTNAKKGSKLFFEFQHQKYEYIPPNMTNSDVLKDLVEKGNILYTFWN